MASSLNLHFYHHPSSLSSKFHCNQFISNPKFSFSFLRPHFPCTKFRVFGSEYAKLKSRNSTLCRFCKGSSHFNNVKGMEEIERPPFDINLAVILAGFAFEAYTTPPDNVGRRETDAADCMTVYLSESFVCEIYDGQLFVKLKKGFSFPAMDPWGTSDPYVVMELDGQVLKSKTKWGTKDPTWNEEFILNIKLSSSALLQEGQTEKGRGEKKDEEKKRKKDEQKGRKADLRREERQKDEEKKERQKDEEKKEVSKRRKKGRKTKRRKKGRKTKRRKKDVPVDEDDEPC